MIGSALRSLARFGLRVAGLNIAGRVSCNVSEIFQPLARVSLRDGEKLVFACPNTMSLWRAKSFYDKEPETIRWIDSFKPGETLLDAGANVGIYTLFAASRGHRVIAVEPESQNFALLNHNIFLNRFDDRVLAFNLALSDENKQSVLFLSKFGIGNALHTAGQEVDFRHQQMKAAFQQGVLEITLDRFLDSTADFFPDHIKIDVDGTEARIIAGASCTLSDPRLKSVLIEINEELACDLEVVKSIQAQGFPCYRREHSASFDSGPFSKSYNYIFIR